MSWLASMTVGFCRKCNKYTQVGFIKKRRFLFFNKTIDVCIECGNEFGGQ